jgi:transmembrane 9 superfamily member 2/4
VDGENNADNTGWKQLYADVFRPPSSYPMIYCAFIGSGAQLGFTALFTIVSFAVGFLSPTRRGSLMKAVLIFYVLFSVVAG